MRFLPKLPIGVGGNVFSINSRILDRSHVAQKFSQVLTLGVLFEIIRHKKFIWGHFFTLDGDTVLEHKLPRVLPSPWYMVRCLKYLPI